MLCVLPYLGISSTPESISHLIIGQSLVFASLPLPLLHSTMIPLDVLKHVGHAEVKAV